MALLRAKEGKNPYYALLHKLPKLPDDITKNILDSISLGLQTTHVVDKKIAKIDGNALSDAEYYRWNTLPELTEWIYDVIPELKDTKTVIGYQLIKKPSNVDKCELHPHTDGEGRGLFCLQYILETGGDNIETIWWKEHKDSMMRGFWKHCWDDSKLEKLMSVQYAPHTWAIMRTDILHSVEYITSSRIAFTIGMYDNDYYTKLIDTYK